MEARGVETVEKGGNDLVCFRFYSFVWENEESLQERKRERKKRKKVREKEKGKERRKRK